MISSSCRHTIRDRHRVVCCLISFLSSDMTTRLSTRSSSSRALSAKEHTQSKKPTKGGREREKNAKASKRMDLSQENVVFDFDYKLIGYRISKSRLVHFVICVGLGCRSKKYSFRSENQSKTQNIFLHFSFTHFFFSSSSPSSSSFANKFFLKYFS